MKNKNTSFIPKNKQKKETAEFFKQVSLTQEEIEKYAQAYIDYINIPKTREFKKAMEFVGFGEEEIHPQAYLHEVYMDICFNWVNKRSEDLLIVLEQIASRTNSKEILSLAGAGPLEDLLNKVPYKIINIMEEFAGKNENFRTMLGGVWTSGIPDDIRHRIEAILHQPGG
jgi:hypothetical protein